MKQNIYIELDEDYKIEDLDKLINDASKYGVMNGDTKYFSFLANENQVRDGIALMEQVPAPLTNHNITREDKKEYDGVFTAYKSYIGICIKFTCKQEMVNA